MTSQTTSKVGFLKHAFTGVGKELIFEPGDATRYHYTVVGIQEGLLVVDVRNGKSVIMAYASIGEPLEWEYKIRSMGHPEKVAKLVGEYIHDAVSAVYFAQLEREKGESFHLFTGGEDSRNGVVRMLAQAPNPYEVVELGTITSYRPRTK